MLVYGDIVRRCAAGVLLAEVAEDLSPGAGDRDGLVAALIGLGQLAQGIADVERDILGCDARSPAQDALNQALLRLARALQSGAPPAADLLAPFQSLADQPVEVRQPEGYAFYALYPEAYAQAAAPLARGSGAEWRVIGVRSIGTGLAAVVAAALGAPPALTVRPVGHPFERRLDLASELSAELAAHEGRFAVVDEGPGLSGSSFGAVIDTLEALGVARRRIHAFPSHAGDLGPQASAPRRERWRDLSRHTVSFARLADGGDRLQAWAAPLVGASVEPLQDLSGGAWRALRYSEETHWPPANAGQERLKFLTRTAGGGWLLKFAGLGRIGARKLALARALHAEGFTPEPAGLAKGFVVERWIEPSAARPGPPPLAAYLAARARLPAGPEAGADLPALLHMARVNAAEAGLQEEAAALDRFAADLPRLQARVRPVLTDNRLHRWEWVATPHGRWLKTDALDHHAAHDLIGAQDIAWDVAGAAVEFDLDPDDTQRLGDAVDADPELLALLLPCYLAFQLGAYAMAAAAHGRWPQEAARLSARRDLYRDHLQRVLASL